MKSLGDTRSTLLAIGHVAGATVASRFLRFLKTLIVVRLLAPEPYGVYAAVGLFLVFSQFLDLGSSAAAFRDLATAVGRGDAGDARRASSRMATLKLTAALLLGGGCLVASLSPGVSAPLRMGLIAVPAIALSSALLAQVLLSLQAQGRAAEFGRVTGLAAVSDLVISVSLTAVWSLPGLLTASALAPLVPLLFAARGGALAPPRAVPWAVLVRYLRTGIPLALLALLDQTLLSVDQIVVMSLLSLPELGLYNVAFALAEGVRTLGVAAALVLGPRLLSEHARAGASLHAIRGLTLQPVLVYARLLPLPIGLLWVGGSYALTRFYPAYEAALRPMQILLVATNFLVVLGGVTTFLLAIDKHARNLLILAPIVGLNVLIDLLLLRLGWGLAGIASGSLITYFCYACASLWYVSSYFEQGVAGRVRFLGGALLPGVGLGLGLGLLEHSFDYRGSFVATVGAGGLVALLCTPLSLHGLRLARQLDRPL